MCWMHIRPLKFVAVPCIDTTGNCPAAFVVNPEFTRLALEKQHADKIKIPKLVENNVPVAPVYSELEPGGMNTGLAPGFRAR